MVICRKRDVAPAPHLGRNDGVPPEVGADVGEQGALVGAVLEAAILEDLEEDLQIMRCIGI